MKILTRDEVADFLRMAPSSLSRHVTMEAWHLIPRPIRIGGRNKWIEHDVIDFINNQCSEPVAKKGKRSRGRPRKTGSAPC